MTTRMESLVLEEGKSFKDLKKGFVLKFSRYEESKIFEYKGLITDKQNENVTILLRDEHKDILQIIALLEEFPMFYVTRVNRIYHNNNNYSTFDSRLTRRNI
ncbi:MAG: hypothetical protein AABX16_00085 [Nanoarchaeota archaeon]